MKSYLLVFSLFLTASFAVAQEPAPTKSPETVEVVKSDEKVQPTEKPVSGSEKKPNLLPSVFLPGDQLPSDVSKEIKDNRRGQMSEEEAAVIPYYNNFMTEYRLGPEDVISVEVFGHPNYSKVNITVPPDGRISYPLVREGISVVKKTRVEVQDEITKKLDEYIIDPKVTVFLDKAASARYSVLGDVAAPGARIMTRRLSVLQAVSEAGGVLRTGNLKQVIVLRSDASGLPRPIIVNLKDIMAGKTQETVYLVPGDQIIVQGNKIKKWEQIMSLIPVIGFARGIMTGGF